MIRFTGAVNDTYDWFVLADTANVDRLQQQHQLNHDLLTALTTTDIGDQVASNGIMLPLIGINNLPYTILFNLDEPSAFDTAGIQPTHRQGGYILEVISGQLHLFTVPYLQDWNQYRPMLLKLAQQNLRPSLTLDNGWYQVTVNVGDMMNEECVSVIEFCLKKHSQQPTFGADISYSFYID